MQQTGAAQAVTLGGNASQRVDAVIIGARVMGAMTAWRLALRWRSVVLVEQSGQLDHGEPEVIDVIEAGLLRNGWAAQRLMPDAATKRWPGMTFDRAVVFSPDGGRVFADRSVAAAIRTAT